jgi:murein L,D-transpeptidase YcbB/YkuD
MGMYLTSARLALFASLVVAIGLTGCRRAVIPEPAQVQAEALPEIPLVLPVDSLDSIYEGLRHASAVFRFYRTVDLRPVWVDDEKASVIGDSLVRFIGQVRLYGLYPDDYHYEFLSQPAPPERIAAELLRRDVLLTDAFVSLARDLRYGRLIEASDDSTSVALLRDVLNSGGLKSKLESRQPDFRQYHALRAALERMILNADSVNQVLLLKGVRSDSSLLDRKVRIVELNLDRWRAETQVWGDRYVLVNIPSYTIEIIDGGVTVLESRAIVGKPQRETPEFSSVIQCFVTYPYWHVPRRIAVEEYLPVIKRDTSFLRRNNFDVLDRKGHIVHPDSLDWKSFNKNNFPVMLRQREGQENSLGVLKFVFDNPYAVFVHDTNAPRLFRLKSRALSHGCIRIEKAPAFAHYLVTGEVGKKSTTVEKYLEEKVRNNIELERPIPIHIRYFTAVTDRNGKVVFLEDIYRKDAELERRIDVSRGANAHGQAR